MKKISKLQSHPRRTMGILVAALAIGMTACSSAIVPPASTPSPPASTINPTPCTQNLVPPVISEVQPAEITSGGEIKVIGSGGYIQDSCGGINESSRTFQLYLDQRPASDLVCYINHCEGKMILDRALRPGLHCLSLQLAGCDFKLPVNAR